MATMPIVEFIVVAALLVLADAMMGPYVHQVDVGGVASSERASAVFDAYMARWRPLRAFLLVAGAAVGTAEKASGHTIFLAMCIAAVSLWAVLFGANAFKARREALRAGS